MPANESGGNVSSWSFLLRGIVAAVRQEIHLSTCPNFPGRLFPHLRIVEQNLWDRAQARLDGIRQSPRAQAVRRSEFWKERRPKYLLTGKAFCGCCGTMLSSVGKNYLGCGTAQRKGTCTNIRSVRRSQIETMILDAPDGP